VRRWKRRCCKAILRACSRPSWPCFGQHPADDLPDLGLNDDRRSLGRRDQRLDAELKLAMDALFLLSLR
jgi:hypothetical protein